MTPCAECRAPDGEGHKMDCRRGAALRLGADPDRVTVVCGVKCCRTCYEHGLTVVWGGCEGPEGHVFTDAQRGQQ